MAEIKSTLDLILERTKDWTMTDEEKAQIKQQEVEGKIRGLVQRLTDGLISMEKAGSEFASLKTREPRLTVQILKKEFLQRISLEMHPDMMITMIRSWIDLETEPLRKIIEHFQERTRNEKASREKDLKTQLKKKGIGGSAVIPNLEADEQWKATHSALEKVFKTRVAEFFKIE